MCISTIEKRSLWIHDTLPNFATNVWLKLGFFTRVLTSGFYWSLSDSKSLQVSRTLLSILDNTLQWFGWTQHFPLLLLRILRLLTTSLFWYSLHFSWLILQPESTRNLELNPLFEPQGISNWTLYLNHRESWTKPFIWTTGNLELNLYLNHRVSRTEPFIWTTGNLELNPLFEPQG